MGGATGEFSDRVEWDVCAYLNEADAKAHVEKAQEYADAWLAQYLMSTMYTRPKTDRANPLDETFTCAFDTGTKYTYFVVDLHDTFTAPEAIQ